MTLDTNSSVLSVATCHFGHTNPAALLFNCGVLWTIGNSHALKFGCMGLTTVFGAGCAVASVLGAMHVYKNGGPTIAGGLAGSTALITYNVWKNFHFFNFLKFAQ